MNKTQESVNLFWKQNSQYENQHAGHEGALEGAAMGKSHDLDPEGRDSDDAEDEEYVSVIV